MISAGAGNLFMAVDAQGFQFTKGAPRAFNKKDRPGSPTRHFCRACGVHLTARSELAPGAVLIKIGTLDDPSVFEGPQLVAGHQRCRSFTCCLRMCPPIRNFPAHQHRRKMLNRVAGRISLPHHLQCSAASGGSV